MGINKKIIVWTALNTSGFNIEREKDINWLNKRIFLMNQYVIPCMENQTDQKFLWFIEIREDTFDFVKEHLKIKNNNFKLIKRPINIDETCMAFIRQKENIKKYVDTEYFYDVRLNSDDLYKNNFIEILNNLKISKDIQAILPQYGYMWYLQNNKLCLRKQKSPPFTTLIYNTKEFLEGFFYYMPRGHEEIIRNLKCYLLENPLWCIIIHDTNNKIYRLGKYTSYKKFQEVELELLKDFIPWKTVKSL
jgi:hypothetical protein